MKSSRTKPESVSLTFFLEVMNHWTTPGVVGAVVGLSLLLLCSGPWGITLGVAASFSGAILSAARFFGLNTVAQKKPRTSSPSREHERILTPQVLFQSEPVPNPVPDFDPLERFLSLLYGVSSDLLKSMRSDVVINATTPLIKCINQIKSDGSWGTELHVDYLARLFAIPYRVVGVSGHVHINNFGNVSSFSAGKSDGIQSGYTNCIQLINHGGKHWTTMFGIEPVVGETETRNYINNPGGGDCLFYAFALGLARLICEEVQDISTLEESALFQTWGRLDSKMRKVGVAEDLYQLGTEANPFNDNVCVSKWMPLQQSLRHLVTKYMCEQLIHEGALALEAYQNIHANQESKNENNKLITELFDKSSLYREFNMLYNLDKKAASEDLATNIFQDLHPTHKSMAYTIQK